MSTAGRRHWPERRALIVLLAVAGALSLWVVAQLLRGYREEMEVFHPPVGTVPLPGDAAALGLAPFRVAAGTEEIAGWFVAPRGGGTVVLCHGNSATRTSLLREARALISAGHGVVLFDFPGHGESTGAVDLGESSQRALRAVLDSTATMSGVDPDRIGVFAFSFGGVIATPVVAKDAHVRAIALVATPVDLTALRNRQIGARLRAQGGFWFWESHESALGPLSIKSVAARLAPRPVFVIGGLADPVVSADDARLLQTLVGPSAELWLVPDAGHGDYTLLHPEYGTRLAEFFTRTLAERNAKDVSP